MKNVPTLRRTLRKMNNSWNSRYKSTELMQRVCVSFLKWCCQNVLRGPKPYVKIYKFFANEPSCEANDDSKSRPRKSEIPRKNNHFRNLKGLFILQWFQFSLNIINSSKIYRFMHEEGQGGLGSGRGERQGITMVDCICTGFYPFKNVTNILSKGNQVIMEIILVTVLW